MRGRVNNGLQEHRERRISRTEHGRELFSCAELRQMVLLKGRTAGAAAGHCPARGSPQERGPCSALEPAPAPGSVAQGPRLAPRAYTLPPPSGIKPCLTRCTFLDSPLSVPQSRGSAKQLPCCPSFRLLYVSYRRKSLRGKSKRKRK